MHLRLRERDPDTRRWLHLHDGPATELIPELTLNEARDLELAMGPVAPAVQVRLEIGGWLAASSRPIDRADYEFRRIEQADGSDWFVVRGRLLKDWVGMTELQLLLFERGEWGVAATARPVFITAGNMAQDEFAPLCEDVAAYPAAALLDVYGKTYFGLELERRPGESAPVATTIRIRQALDQLAAALREVASQPAYRLRARGSANHLDQGVTDLTLEEAPGPDGRGPAPRALAFRRNAGTGGRDPLQPAREPRPVRVPPLPRRPASRPADPPPRRHRRA